MNDKITIKVYEVVGSSACVSADDGQMVYEQIAAAMRSGRNVELSFLNVSSLTSAFLNPAIGQLYDQFSDDQIREHLSVTEMENDDRALLKRVVETAKRYFKDPVRFNNAQKEILEIN